MWASVFQTFWPVMTHSSPSRTARVARLARSEPDPGSLKSWHHASSPVNVRRSSLAAELVGAVGHHGGTGHGEPEELTGPGRGGTGLGQAPVDDALQVGREPETAEALGERDPGEPEVVLATPELLDAHRLRVHLLEQLRRALLDDRRVICHDTTLPPVARPGQGWSRWTCQPSPDGS